MSLATRCPSCGTVFRVVQDQLRVSEGWVRCGRCNGVFNAAEVLFDIDTGAAVQLDLGLPTAADPLAPAAPPREAPTPAAQAPINVHAPHPPTDWTALGADPALSVAWPDDRQEPQFDHDPAWVPGGPAEPGFAAPLANRGQGTAAQHDEPLLRTPSRHADGPEADDRQRPADDDLADDPIIVTDHVPNHLPTHASAPTSAHASTQAPAPLVTAAMAQPAAAPEPCASPVQAVPSFLRTADRGARWRRPAVRVAVAASVGVLTLTLAVQVALTWRDSLAARLPASTPALQALCKLAGCSVQPLRRIESLSVHSSALNRLDGSTLYRLQVVLHNGADTAVMMPALDLSLTDGQGKLVARRVLQPAELGAPQSVLQAGEELPIKALMSTGERRVDGYTLELFYP